MPSLQPTCLLTGNKCSAIPLKSGTSEGCPLPMHIPHNTCSLSYISETTEGDQGQLNKEKVEVSLFGDNMGVYMYGRKKSHQEIDTAIKHFYQSSRLKN